VMCCRGQLMKHVS